MLNKEQQDKIEKLYGEGFSYSEIAKSIEISKATVHNYLKGKVKPKKDIKEIEQIFNNSENLNVKQSLSNRSDLDISTATKELNDLKQEVINNLQEQVYTNKKELTNEIKGHIDSWITDIEVRITNLEREINDKILKIYEELTKLNDKIK